MQDETIDDDDDPPTYAYDQCERWHGAHDRLHYFGGEPASITYSSDASTCQQRIEADQPWNYRDHSVWHDHLYHCDTNEYIAFFLMAYTRVIYTHGWPRNDSVIEAMRYMGRSPI